MSQRWSRGGARRGVGEGRGPGPQRLSFLQVEKGGFSFPGEAPACGQAPRLKGPGLCGSRRVILSPRPSPEMGRLGAGLWVAGGQPWLVPAGRPPGPQGPWRPSLPAGGGPSRAAGLSLGWWPSPPATCCGLFQLPPLLGWGCADGPEQSPVAWPPGPAVPTPGLPFNISVPQAPQTQGSPQGRAGVGGHSLPGASEPPFELCLPPASSLSTSQGDCL